VDRVGAAEDGRGDFAGAVGTPENTGCKAADRKTAAMLRKNVKISDRVFIPISSLVQITNVHSNVNHEL
jgi:hypothetical protein